MRRRFLRLVVPLIPGLLVLAPFQRFVSSLNPPRGIEHFWAFYTAFFRDFHFSWSFQFISQYWLHMWFLAYLFAITAACAPILVWLRRPAGRRVTSTLVAIAGRRGGLFMLAVPLVLTQLVLRPRFPAYQDWADIATYTLAFLLGAVLLSDRRFEAAIVRQIRWLVGTGVLAALGLVVLAFLAHIRLTGEVHAQPSAQLAQSVLWSVFIWSWLLAVTYLGIRWLDFPARSLRYAEQSILPVYVIHHPVLLLVAFFAVTWNLGVWPTFALLLLLVLGTTLAIYEFGVRRWRVMRLLFGLSPAARGQAPESAQRQLSASPSEASASPARGGSWHRPRRHPMGGPRAG